MTHPAIAKQLRERKVDEILATGAETVVVGNPGCHLQIEAGLRLRGARVEAVHTVSLLAESCRRGLRERSLPISAPSPIGDEAAPKTVEG